MSESNKRQSTFDSVLIIIKLRSTLGELQRVPVRTEGIMSPNDFRATEAGLQIRDAVCMTLMVVGEEVKNIDKKSDGQLLARYPQINWKGVMGVRDKIAHSYFDIDTEQLFDICKNKVPELVEVLHL